MPDYADRSNFEARLTRALLAATKPARDAASPDAIPWGSLGPAVKHAVDDETLKVFTAIYLFMMATDSLSPGAATMIRRWTSSNATTFSSSFLAKSRERIAAGAAPADVFGRDRISSGAATEVTRTITAAEVAAVRGAAEVAAVRGATTVNLDGATWQTEQDGRVCPICRPLHGKPYAVFSLTAPAGPPAHPNCRCMRPIHASISAFPPLKSDTGTR